MSPWCPFSHGACATFMAVCLQCYATIVASGHVLVSPSCPYATITACGHVLTSPLWPRYLCHLHDRVATVPVLLLSPRATLFCPLHAHVATILMPFSYPCVCDVCIAFMPIHLQCLCHLCVHVAAESVQPWCLYHPGHSACNLPVLTRLWCPRRSQSLYHLPTHMAPCITLVPVWPWVRVV